MSENLAYQPPVTLEQPSVIPEANTGYGWRTKLAAGGLSVLALAGCTVGNKNNVANTSPASASATVDPALTQRVMEVCKDIPKENNAADTQFAQPEADFPKLYTTEGDKNVPLPKEKAAEVIKSQIINDERVGAVFNEFFVQTRQALQLPDAGTLKNAGTRIDNYQSKPGLREEDLVQSCNALAMLDYTNNFAITRGQAQEVIATRNENGVNQFSTRTLNQTGVVDGYRVGFNEDDSSLTDGQKEVLRKISDVMLITLDGRIIVNLTFGPDSIDIKQQDKQEQQGQQQQQDQGGITGGESGNTGDKGNSPGNLPQNNSGPAGGPRSGSGGAPEGRPGGTDDTPAGGGTPTRGPGTGPSKSPGPGPSESPGPVPRPTESSRPTEPQPTKPATESPAPKPTHGCDPNIEIC